MRHPSLRALATIILTLACFAQGVGALSSVQAADCGSGIGVCHCGDRVVTNARLNGSDPVLRTVCPCDGLIVASGVTLEIRGTITGESDLCSGIVVEGGATGVTVKTGRITGFGLGVNGDAPEGPVSNSRFTDLQIRGGFAGLLITGDGNLVESNVVRDAFVAGILLIGDGNTVRLNRAEGTALFGISAIGDANVLSRNVAQRNSGDGIAFSGQNVTADGNRSAYNGGAGFIVEGTGQTVSRNVATGNALQGFAVSADASTLDHNRGDYNLLVGIEDTGTGNAYVDNRCTGNAEGPSSPPGLCR